MKYSGLFLMKGEDLFCEKRREYIIKHFIVRIS